MEDRYSVLIRLMNQLTADGFYCSFNGKKFSPSEVDFLLICFEELLFVRVEWFIDLWFIIGFLWFNFS